MDVIEIQDNKRETELIKLFKLKKTNVNRIGIDARLLFQKQKFDFEIKSTTVGKVSTASPMTLEHIKKWRTQYWIIGIYNKDAILDHCVFGTPNDMKEWLDYWENDIKRGLKISDMLVDKIDYNMVNKIFGDKKYYSYDEAKFVFKNLYTKDQYKELKDHPNGYSKNMMLKMFKAHNKVYLYRGASINNPRISKKYYQNWIKIYDNHANKLRKIFKEIVLQ